MERTTPLGAERVFRVLRMTQILALIGVLLIGGTAWAQPKPPQPTPEERQKLEAEKQKAEQEKKLKEQQERQRHELERQKAEQERKQKAEQDRIKAEQERKQKEEDRRVAEILNQAKSAFDQRNWPHSANKYREFLGHFPKRPEAPAARFGLAMAMVENLDKDWNTIANELGQVVAGEGIPDTGRAHYWMAVSLRITGEQILDASRNAQGDQAKDLSNKATERLGQAAHHYNVAQAALNASVNPRPNADVKEIPPAIELAARARAECAEMLVKLGRFKEALDVGLPVLADPLLARTSQRPLALLAVGQAYAGLKDYGNTFRHLSGLAPFDRLGIGLPALVTLAQIKAQTGEKPEALADLNDAIKSYSRHRPAVEAELRNRETWRTRPLDQQRLEAMLRGPDYLLSAWHTAAMLHLEYGQYAEAAPKLQAFVQTAPKSLLAPAAQLQLGICLTQMRNGEAHRWLAPLENHPQMGDEAIYWVARFQKAIADPNNRGQVEQHSREALKTLARALERNAAIAATDPAAKTRRAMILLEQGDTFVFFNQFKEAVAPYQGAAEDLSNLDRAAEAHEKWIVCLNKAGDLAGCEQACAKFLERYPMSILRANAAYWQAQCAYQQAIELARKPETVPQSRQMQQVAAQRFAVVVDKYPDSTYAGAARFGVGLTHYRQGEWAKAAKLFAGINDAEKTGDVAMASYFHADCLLRTLPEGGDDALSAARLTQQLEEAGKQLATFVSSGEFAETPDAMVRLADCLQRVATMVADQQERQKGFQTARETYEKLLAKYPKHPAFAQAVMDRARLLATVGDPGSAINELNRFRGEPVLMKSDVAPMALVRLASLMTIHGRGVDAAAMIEKARNEYEPQLAKDPSRSSWIASMRLAHGTALRGANRPKEALALFDGIQKDYPNSVEATEASLGSLLIRKDEAMARLRGARQAVVGQPLDKPADEKLLAAQAEALKGVKEIATALSGHAERIGEKSSGSDLHVRTLRDAGDVWRGVGEIEVDSFRRDLAAKSLVKMRDRIAKVPAAARSNSIPRPPEIKLAQVPVQASETRARELYNAVLEAAPDVPLALEVRMGLVAMHMEREEADPAIGLLGAAIDRNPPAPMGDFLRVQLGHCLLVKKQPDQALALATKALEDSGSPVRAAAYLLKGKVLLQQKNYGEAAGILQRFRGGAEKYINAGHVTEEGLFRLAQAYYGAGSWEECRATSEHLMGRFGGTRWFAEARFLQGWSLQQAKQFDRAVEAYLDVPRRTSSDLAARAQFQIGLCRAEQKRWQDAANEFLAVSATYDYTEVSAPSSLEAARALVQLKKPVEAREVLHRVVSDHPETQWAAEAQKRIKEIQ